MGCGSSAPSGDQPTRQEQTNTREQSNNQRPAETQKQQAAVPKSSSEFIEDAVRHHNELRAKHGADPLTHAQDLTDYAQAWADKIAKENNMKHSDCKHSTGHIGENIAWSSADGQMASAKGCVQMWYDEVKDYNFNTQGFSMGTGHFTQVVWKGTKELGIARAISSTGAVFTVANYRPPGNFEGQFENNVFPAV